MLNGTLRGQVVSRWWYGEKQKNVCAVLRVRFEQFLNGEKKPVIVDCWCPAFMLKREKFIMNENVKYLTVTFNGVVTIPPHKDNPPELTLGVIVSDLFL